MMPCSASTTKTQQQKLRIRPRPVRRRGRLAPMIAGTLVAAVCLVLAGPSITSVVDALASVSPSVVAKKPKHQQQPLAVGPVSAEELLLKRGSQWAGAGLDEDEEFDDDDDDDEFYGEADLLVGKRFQELQQNTGSEILQSELQDLVDQGPREFLEQMGESSQLEKVAMSSVTEQLPQVAVQALMQQQQQQQQQGESKKQPHQNLNKKKNDKQLHYSKSRVTAKEEIELAKIIQHGVSLHKIKREKEAVLERPLTKMEWADAVNLSPKQLRQSVARYRQAKHQLVTANLGLVHTVVNQIYNPNHVNAVSKEELVQEGSLGLLRAAELFDPTRGLRFSTYAVVWIKGVLSNSHVPELVKVPNREKTKMNKIRNAQKQLGDDNATVEALASVAGLTVSEVIQTKKRMAQAQHVLSLDEQHKMASRSGVDTGSAVETNPVFVKDKNFQQDADLAERTQLQADVIAAMARNLDAREARLMRLRYGLSDGHGRTLEECAEAMGLSYSRVQQLSKTCLKKLREAAEAESLEEYLLTIA